MAGRELAGDPHVLEFLSGNLQEHVERIWNEFPSPYTNREDRRRVRVLEPQARGSEAGLPDLTRE